MTVRAGGHVLRGGRWVPADLVAAEPAPAVEPEPAPPPAAGDVPAAGRTVCPDCGKDVALNKDGSPRKHRCAEAGGE